MTQEEKQILLRDLCARIPYRTLVQLNPGAYNKPETCILTGVDGEEIYLNVDSDPFRIGHIKPYLRPMSSMTEEELKQFAILNFQDNEIWEISDLSVINNDFVNVRCKHKHQEETEWTLWTFQISKREMLKSWRGIDWLTEHHFDFRGLIDKGLALEAPPEMYNKEESEEGSGIPVPKTVDEAISTLEKILSDEDREYLLKNGAISMHNSLGRWIRNEWGLWTGSELKDELMNMNKGLNHPDDMSNYIIEEFIKYWNNKL